MIRFAAGVAVGVAGAYYGFWGWLTWKLFKGV